VLAAADAYSYLHLLIVAGIIIFAVGVRFAVLSAADSLDAAARLALCGGAALYLLGHLAFRWRMLGQVAWTKAVAAAAMMVLFAVGSAWPAWTLVGGVAALIVLLCALETRS
jgi:low temperature requirement protein LtrA